MLDRGVLSGPFAPEVRALEEEFASYKECLFVTNDEELPIRASRTRMFGENIRPADAASFRIDRALDSDRAYDSVTMGWMYRTNEMSAALARSQLKRLDIWNMNARRNAEYLSERLSELSGVNPPMVPSDRASSFHKFRVSLNPKEFGITASPVSVRQAVLRALVAEGVEAVLWQTQPVPGQTLFREKIGYGNAALGIGLYPLTMILANIRDQDCSTFGELDFAYFRTHLSDCRTAAFTLRSIATLEAVCQGMGKSG